MKWYTCIDERGLETGGECLAVSLRSCLRQTGLQPHVIYRGAPNRFTDFLVREGAELHMIDDAGLEGSFSASSRAEPFDRDWAASMMLRFEIPRVDPTDDVVLYTDTDVLFRGPVPPFGRDTVLAAANELIVEAGTARETADAFNAGVMAMHLGVFRSLRPEIWRLMGLVSSGALDLPWYEQGVLNHLLSGHRAGIPQALNFRPYLATGDQEPLVVHFQFLKPWTFMSTTPLDDRQRRLFAMGRGNYLRFGREYLSHLDERATAALLGACPDARLTLPA